jgi:hypothetical protein
MHSLDLQVPKLAHKILQFENAEKKCLRFFRSRESEKTLKNIRLDKNDDKFQGLFFEEASFDAAGVSS